MGDSAFRDMCPFLFVLLLPAANFYHLPFLNYSTSTGSDFQVKLSSFDFALRLTSLRLCLRHLDEQNSVSRSCPAVCCRRYFPSIIRPCGFFPTTGTLNTIVLQQFLCGWQREKDQGSWFLWVDVCGCAWCRYWTHFVRWAPQDRSHWASANAFTREVAGQATPRVCAARTTISGATT